MNIVSNNETERKGFSGRILTTESIGKPFPEAWTPTVPGEEEALRDNSIVFDRLHVEEQNVEDQDGLFGYPDPDASDTASPPIGEFSNSDAQAAVEEWRIQAVGRRPIDFLARDCLFSTLFRDARVPWFHRYVRKPPAWMEELVAQIEDAGLRKQALQHVALHYLHKRHLVRVRRWVQEYIGDDAEELTYLNRLWRCTPYGVLVSRCDGQRLPFPCGLSRLCPWCHARRVVKLYQCLQTGPMSNPVVTHLFFGRALPVLQPKYPDYCEYTRKDLARGLMDDAYELGIDDGVWMHQVGSGLEKNGRPTFVHDISLIGAVDNAAFDRMERDPNGMVFGGGIRTVLSGDEEFVFPVRWLLLPMDLPVR